MGGLTLEQYELVEHFNEYTTEKNKHRSLLIEDSLKVDSQTDTGWHLPSQQAVSSLILTQNYINTLRFSHLVHAFIQSDL